MMTVKERNQLLRVVKKDVGTLDGTICFLQAKIRHFCQVAGKPTLGNRRVNRILAYVLTRHIVVDELFTVIDSIVEGTVKKHLLTVESSFTRTLCGRDKESLYFDLTSEAEFLRLIPTWRCGQCWSIVMKGGLSDGKEKGARAEPGLAGPAPVRASELRAGAGVPAGGEGVPRSL